MYDEKQGPIDNLVHLWVDGAYNRRELVRQVARYTGSIAAALTVLGGYEAWGQASTPCPADVRVPADAPDLTTRDVSFPGEDSSIFGYLARPKNATGRTPAVIVIHENQGLLDHHKDVTRRVARAGFIGIAPDLLSRQGGTQQFATANDRTQAYGRTTTFGRQADIISTLSYIKGVDGVRHDRIGMVGFCAGGGNVWQLATVLDELAAAVPFYGPPPTVDALDGIKAPVLALYAERDRNLTMQMAPIMSAMLQKQKTFGMVVYEGASHAFHNDTGNAYNAEAACDAWSRTIAWFNKYLRAA